MFSTRMRIRPMKHLRVAAAGAALLSAALDVASVAARQAAPDQVPAASTQAASERAAERLKALKEEADSLLARERSLLTDLRRLEVERAMAAERLAQNETETKNLEQELADTVRHRELLEQARAAEAPILRNRLVELYKLGSGGYLRLLLGVDDLRDVGRAYRTVSALAALDRERARAHESTLKSLAQVEQDLTARQAELAALHDEAVTARAAADRAVRERTALIARIDQRRDLNAQLTGELQAAQSRLQQTVSDLGGNAPVLPLRPFQGTLSWPVTGRVVTRARMQSDSTAPSASPQNGIEIAAPVGASVMAVHDGTVAFAGPFEGFGRLVILDHGNKSYSLYGYLDEVGVSRGAQIERGRSLGTVGTSPTGMNLLYFELRVDGHVVDPLQWLKDRP